MTSYQHPGVYVNEISSGSKPIEGAGTSVVAILGETLKGPIEPTIINSWDDYQLIFGGTDSSQDLMGNYVNAFYLNGGGKAHIFTAKRAVQASTIISKVIILDDIETTIDLIKIQALKASDEVEIQVTFTADNDKLNVDVITSIGSEIKQTENYQGLSLNRNAFDFFAEVLNEQSEIIRIAVLSTPDSENDYLTLDSIISAEPYQLTGGVTAKADDYTSCFTELKEREDINIILLPGQALSKDDYTNSVVTKAISHCEAMADRMVIVDPPQSKKLDGSEALGCKTKYAALYYPWIKSVDNIDLPPSAFAAGLWCRTDGNRGVWKAPAGMEASLRGVKSFEFVVGNADQDALNPANINVLRKMNGTPVSWGARVFTNDPEWKYIPVRRTALHIGDSIKQGIQWAVFEPNNNNLWSSLRINIESFLDNMFRSGAFQGQTASQAYFVKCGIGSTMTQAEVDAGMVIVQVGFAALKPAEFVIVNVQQKVEQ